MMPKLLITAAAVVILGVAGTVWVRVWGPAAKQPEANLGLPPATAKVVRTTLAETRTLPGTLGYGDLVPVSATGTLTWIAPVGSTVKRGEPLFKVAERPVVVLYGSVPLYRTLHADTLLAQIRPTPLQLKVDQTESSLRLARLRLAQLKKGPRPEEVAAVAAAVQSAQAKLVDLQMGPSPDDVTSAQSALSSAQTKLDHLLNPDPRDVATAQSAVQAAQANLDKVKAGPTQAEIVSAQAAVSAADNARQQDSIALSNVKDSPDQKPTDQTRLRAAMAADDANIAVAKAKLAEVLAGPSQAEIASAESALKMADQKLDQLLSPTTSDVAAAQAAVDQAQAKLAAVAQGPKAADLQAAQSAELSAQSQLALRTAPPSEFDVAQAEEEVRQAEIALREARTEFDDGVKGADVQQLKENLAELGYTGFTIDDTYSLATAEAVRTWQADLGLPETGTLETGQAVFTPGAVRIVEQTARVGDTVGGSSDGRVVSVLRYTGTTRLVTVSLGVADQALAVDGRKVTVRGVPGRPTMEGEISQVGAVVTAPSTTPTTGSARSTISDPRIEVNVAIADQEALASLEGAPVDVDFVIEERKDVLAVPVTALVGKSGGGFAVEVLREGGRRELVTVKLGLFDTAGGRVQVEGDLGEGDQVVVPSL